MADVILQHRSALFGIAKPGRYGRASGAVGVTVREVMGFAAMTITARKGAAVEVRRALSAQFAHDIADAPKRAARGALSIVGVNACGMFRFDVVLYVSISIRYL